MKQAGAILVPFDASGLINVGKLAWGGVQEKSSAYETSDTTARYTLSAPPMRILRDSKHSLTTSFSPQQLGNLAA